MDNNNPTTTPLVRFQTRTGSESHTTERRGVMVYIGEGAKKKPIYEVFKPETSEWELVGTKGRHGKYCVAEYNIPVGTVITFEASANGQPKINEVFTVDSDQNIDLEGYYYQGQPSGWIVSI